MSRTNPYLGYVQTTRTLFIVIEEVECVFITSIVHDKSATGYRQFLSRCDDECSRHLWILSSRFFSSIVYFVFLFFFGGVLFFLCKDTIFLVQFYVSDSWYIWIFDCVCDVCLFACLFRSEDIADLAGSPRTPCSLVFMWLHMPSGRAETEAPTGDPAVYKSESAMPPSRSVCPDTGRGCCAMPSMTRRAR